MNKNRKAIKKEEDKQEEEDSIPSLQIIEKEKIIKKQTIRIISAQSKRQIMQQIKKKAKLQTLKRIRQIREENGKTGTRQLNRIDFNPHQVIQTGLFMIKNDSFVQLSVNTMYNASCLAINTKPCPSGTCDFEVLNVAGEFKMGLVNDNTIKRVTLKNSITFCTLKKRLKVGQQQYKQIKAEMAQGSRIRMMVCIITQKFRLYVNDKKVCTCDFPPSLASSNIYFYLKLYQSSCAKILLK